LYETVVMTAATQGDANRANHWRGLSYDRYTGRGWSVSAESRESIAAGQDILLPPVAAAVIVTQTITRTDDIAAIRYTLGLPLRFDHRVTVHRRGLEDLSRVEGQGGSYSAVSRISSAGVAELRSASLADVPPALMARYAALPDNVPERVFDLAWQVTGEANTPFDQAKALETFLRQYPYSLDVELPPAGRDPVDYFLFDLQAGYCDYYASAMVVLARTLGLPARLAAGYLAQPNVDGLQTIRQLNAHSWAEVYFAGYGWLEFEPTAAFPVELAPPPLPGEPGFVDSAALTGAPPPIPEPRPDKTGYLWLLALIPLFLGGWWLWRTRRKTRLVLPDQTSWAYHRLQRRASRLGQPVQPSQTPDEFADAFLTRLHDLDRGRLVSRLQLAQLALEIRRLSRDFSGRQYARQKPPAESAAASWRRIRRRLWLLSLIEDLRGLWPFQQEEVV
jgi:transglutaminase-like putative cysteine protease